jgi:hypothetical protein
VIERVGAPIFFKRQQGRVVGPEAMPFITISGVSWWEAFYEDGRTIGEWDSILEDRRKVKVPKRGMAASSRWEEISHKGMRGLRLIGPDGHVADLRSETDDKFFQFKQGIAVLGQRDQRRMAGLHREAHIIGVVVSDRGDCVCFAWEHVDQEGRPFPDLPVGRMIGPFTEKIGVGTVKVMIDGKLVDRPDGMTYRQIGPLSLENLGLKL